MCLCVFRITNGAGAELNSHLRFWYAVVSLFHSTYLCYIVSLECFELEIFYGFLFYPKEREKDRLLFCKTPNSIRFLFVLFYSLANVFCIYSILIVLGSDCYFTTQTYRYTDTNKWINKNKQIHKHTHTHTAN